MKIAKEFWFSMGHTLHNHSGKCANLHGHNYCLIVTVCSDILNSQAMVMDFGDLKRIVSDIIDRDYDHRFLIYENDERADRLKVLDQSVSIVSFNPTAEMLAYTIKQQIDARLINLEVSNLILRETENSYAEV